MGRTLVDSQVAMCTDAMRIWSLLLSGLPHDSRKSELYRDGAGQGGSWGSQSFKGWLLLPGMLETGIASQAEH